jgi:hypothetical protein
MSEQQANQQQGESSLSNNTALVVLFWGYVTIPLIWALYRTFGNISALFTG